MKKIIISSLLLIVCITVISYRIHSNPYKEIFSNTPDYMVFDNDTLWKFLDVFETYQPDSHVSDRSTSFINKNGSMLVTIFDSDYGNYSDLYIAADNDTVVFDIYEDSIVGRNCPIFYGLKNRLITFNENYYHHLKYQLRYEYDESNHIVSIYSKSTLREDEKWWLVLTFQWEKNLLVRKYRHKMISRLTYNYYYENDEGTHKYGSLSHLYDIFLKEDIPFLLLGYFGEVPDGNLTKVRCLKSFSLFPRPMWNVYVNEFNKDGLLEKSVRKNDIGKETFYFDIIDDVIKEKRE